MPWNGTSGFSCLRYDTVRRNRNLRKQPTGLRIRSLLMPSSSNFSCENLAAIRTDHYSVKYRSILRIAGASLHQVFPEESQHRKGGWKKLEPLPCHCVLAIFGMLPI
jgi:hypothetical protein